MAEVEISGRFGWSTKGNSMFDHRSICWRDEETNVYEGKKKCSYFHLCPEQMTTDVHWCSVEFRGDEAIVEWSNPTPLGNYGYKGITQDKSIINRSVWRVLVLGETIIEDRITYRDAMNAWAESISSNGLECKDVSNQHRGVAEKVFVITRKHSVPNDKSEVCYMYWDSLGTAMFSPTPIMHKNTKALRCALCSKPILTE